MAYDKDVFVKRFSEVVGNDSQETIANRLHMTQGNVSKIIAGRQMPKLDTVYLISEEYNVSVDWLLGLSEEKQIIQMSSNMLSYATAVDTVMALECHGSEIQEIPREDKIIVNIKDPLFFTLLKKSRSLRNTDFEMYDAWKKDKLSQFADKPILWHNSWTEGKDFDLLIGEASTEAHWLKVYEIVKEYEDEMAEIMRPDSSIFDD